MEIQTILGEKIRWADRTGANAVFGSAPSGSPLSTIHEASGEGP